jgi:hypothetical protein
MTFARDNRRIVVADSGLIVQDREKAAVFTVSQRWAPMEANGKKSLGLDIAADSGILKVKCQAGNCKCLIVAAKGTSATRYAARIMFFEIIPARWNLYL